MIVEREIPFRLDQSLFLQPTFADTTTRCVNPLEPHYEFRGMQVYDDPKGVKPRPLKPLLSETTLLRTIDIPGAQPKLSRAKSVRHPRDPIGIQDIEGAQANTLKRTIVSDRCSDPVCPTYQSLDDDGTQLEPAHKPLVPPHLVSPPYHGFGEFSRQARVKQSLVNTSGQSISSANDSISDSSIVLVQRVASSTPLATVTSSTGGVLLPIDDDPSRKPNEAKDQQSYRPTQSSIFDHYLNPPVGPSLDKVSRVNVFGKNARRSGEAGSIAHTPSSTLSATVMQEILNQTIRPHLAGKISGGPSGRPRVGKITSRLQSMESQFAGSGHVMTATQRKAYQELRDEVAAVRSLKL